MKQYKNWALLALGIIAFAVAVRLYRNYKDKQAEAEPAEPLPPGSGSGAGNTSPGPPVQRLDVDKRLKRGVKGGEVKELQNRMNKDRGQHLPIVADGDFGPKTEALLLKLRNRTETTLRDYAAAVASTGVDTTSWSWLFGNN